MKILAIIPSRYGSTRFPGKPLVQIEGKSMIQRVYERSSSAFENVCVATDDQRIIDEVKRFGGDAIMTSSSHKSGTDRCFEALTIVEKRDSVQYDIVVNVQGDEPFIAPAQLKELVDCFRDSDTKIATLVKRFSPEEDIFSPNTPKVVVSKKMKALYFSRSVVPYRRGVDPGNWNDGFTYYKHIGLYAFTRNTLAAVTKLKQMPLELAEQLEQLRWLENGYEIRVAVTECQSYSIDTPEDLELLIAKKIINTGV
jgi:3-deoxy-manno-octulosonate cytidylyltransferase (CMP-KDO synthetase)